MMEIYKDWKKLSQHANYEIFDRSRCNLKQASKFSWSENLIEIDNASNAGLTISN
jgi:hypothetical protein